MRILNQLMHPLVHDEVNKKIVQLKRLYKGKKHLSVCLEAFYFEPKDLGTFIDRLVIVDAPDAAIMKRVAQRGIAAAEIKTLLKFQRKIVPKSPYVIYNDRDKISLYANIIRTCHRP